MNDLFDRLAAINAVSLTEAIRQVILCLVLFQIIAWNEQQIAGFLMAISAVLALFARGATVSNARVEQKVAEKVAHREMAGTAGTGAGLSPARSDADA